MIFGRYTIISRKGSKDVVISDFTLMLEFEASLCWIWASILGVCGGATSCNLKICLLSSLGQSSTAMIRNSRDIKYSVYHILRSCVTMFDKRRHLWDSPLSVMSSRSSSTLSAYYEPQRQGTPDSYDPVKMIPGAYPEESSKGILLFIV